MQGDFHEENFNTAMAVLKDAGDNAKGDQKGRKGGFKGNIAYFTYNISANTYAFFEIRAQKWS